MESLIDSGFAGVIFLMVNKKATTTVKFAVGTIYRNSSTPPGVRALE